MIKHESLIINPQKNQPLISQKDLIDPKCCLLFLIASLLKLTVKSPVTRNLVFFIEGTTMLEIEKLFI